MRDVEAVPRAQLAAVKSSLPAGGLPVAGAAPRAAENARSPDAAADPPYKYTSVRILYASDTGTAAELATDLGDLLGAAAAGRTPPLPVSVSPLLRSSLPPHAPPLPPNDGDGGGPLHLLLISTAGDGVLPAPALPAWRGLCVAALPRTTAAGVRLAVFGLGDRRYARFGAAARKVSRRLVDGLGATAVLPLVLSDESAPGGGGHDAAFVPWVEDVLGLLQLPRDAAAGGGGGPRAGPPPDKYVVTPVDAGAVGGAAGKSLRAMVAAHAWPVGDDGAPVVSPEGVDAWGRWMPAVAASDQDPASVAADARVAGGDVWSADAHTAGVWAGAPDERVSVLVDPTGGRPPTGGDVDAAAAAPAPVLPLTVVASTVMTDAAVMAADGDNRVVREVRLRAPGGADTPTYAPGDVLHLAVRNRPAAVAAFFSLTGLVPQTAIHIAAAGDGAAPPLLNTVNPATVAEVVAAHLDITALPGRLFFARLAPYATDPAAAERLRYFASPDGPGAAARRQYAVAEARTILMVLRDFPSARPPLAALLRLIPRLRPRAYSLASAAAAHGRELGIAAALVEYVTPLRRRRRGVASAFFSALVPGDVVPGWIAPGVLSFGGGGGVPPGGAICVGPGTGIAPFRAYAHHLWAIGAAAPESGVPPTAAGPGVHVFFGCRHAAGDNLFADEWPMLPVTLWAAYSRDPPPPPRAYVTNLLVSPTGAAAVRAVVAAGGGIFVAGAAGAMPRDVRAAVVTALAGGEAGDMAAAERLVGKLESTGRYQVECWAC
ncbi:hypothetical protein MMPV_001084 [Pyropia vietnamensis]